MSEKTAGWKALFGREERGHARLAAIARMDTINGGARAMVLEKRLAALGSLLGTAGIVADVYSASTGKWSREHEAWECPECGGASLGLERALQCCAAKVSDEG